MYHNKEAVEQERMLIMGHEHASGMPNDNDFSFDPSIFHPKLVITVLLNGCMFFLYNFLSFTVLTKVSNIFSYII